MSRTLRVHPPVTSALLEVVRERFDGAASAHPDGTVVVTGDLDQAALRALLTLLWDTGHAVLTVN